jgi:hypothetical protein
VENSRLPAAVIETPAYDRHLKPEERVVLDFDGAVAGDSIGVRGLSVTPISESA